jgi:transposase
MEYINGVPREQSFLFPERLEDYVDESNPVRFVDAFVESLDFIKLKFKHSARGEMGRPAYRPADLMKLYIYGYLNGIRASRKLEAECHRNIDLMWLIRKVEPDFKTIADFRKDNLEAIAGVFCEFSMFCHKHDLFGKQLVAIDGSKFQGNSSKDRNFSEPKLERLIEHFQERIDQFLKLMEEADKEEVEDVSLQKEKLQEVIESLKKKKEEKKSLLNRLKESGESQISLTDPDARRLHSGDGSLVGYNVQLAIDSGNKLIAAYKVTNAPNDLNQLTPMALAAKEALQAENLQVLADKGYYNSEQLKSCEHAGFTTFVNQVNRENRTGLFSNDQFIYQSENDTYQCPAHQELTYRRTKLNQGRQMRVYKTTACKGCQLRAQCTTQKKDGRIILRWENQEILDAVAQRVASQPEKRTLRKALAEHPFGTIKRAMNFQHFLLRGFKKVYGEFSLIALAYNIKRVFNILIIKSRGNPYGFPKFLVTD